ncbi:MarR family transcriptional regulator [Actinomycetospora sp. NBRC 106375]|uniref:MarR family winged helix-turn-helix transcriptional regulator n=1 Tax=Actinomycetospora sp. NBRC 106375 TaxID=3032207 RepID=UPI0024A4D21C|nr:MarR family transcriptional regulator [Actinomycetospora sp. NBRC 106375]GLZ44999.1 MarR family transcriptional regulator [Actinomycetospora sp. NBRC 106375]
MPSESDLLGELLPRLTQLSAVLTRSRVVDDAQKAAGASIDRPGIGILTALRLAGRPMRIGEIAERQQVAGPHVTRTVAGLEQRGMVHRVTDPDDLRARLVELTDEGAAAADRYVQTVFGFFADVLGDWSDDDRRMLGALLSRLVDDITARLA